VRPARDSPTFASAVGNLDPRVDLDSHLKHGDARYNAYLSMMAAKLSYENNPFVETTIQDRWKVHFSPTIDMISTDKHRVMIHRPV